MEIRDTREKPLEIQISEYLYERGIKSLDDVKDLLEPNFFAVIPLSILEKENISANAKLLYAEIVALSKKSGKCFATNEYLAERLGLARTSIPKLLKELKDDMLIAVNIKRDSSGTFRNIRVSLIGDKGYSQTTRGGIPKLRGQKRNRQIEIDKESLGNENVSKVRELIFLFKDVNPSYEVLFKRTNQREAIERLVNTHGHDKIEATIKALPQIITKKYAPKITTPIQLESRLGELVAFYKQEQSSKTPIITI